MGHREREMPVEGYGPRSARRRPTGGSAELPKGTLDPRAVLALQRAAGNQAVQRLVLQRKELDTAALKKDIDWVERNRFDSTQNWDTFEGCRPDWAKENTSNAVADWWEYRTGGPAKLYKDERHRKNTGLGFPSMNLEQRNRSGGRMIYHIPTVVSPNDQKLVDAAEGITTSAPAETKPPSMWEMAAKMTPTTPSGKSAWDDD